MTPETSAFLVPVRRGSVFKFAQHFRIRTLLPNICLAPSFSKLFGNFVVTVVLPGNNSQRFCGPFICLICMIGNSITASVNPKWKKVPVNNGVTIGQYNRKQVFSFCRKELLLLPHTRTRRPGPIQDKIPHWLPTLEHDQLMHRLQEVSESQQWYAGLTELTGNCTFSLSSHLDTFGPKTSAPTVSLYGGSKDIHLGSLCAWYGTCVEYFKYENVGYLRISWLLCSQLHTVRNRGRTVHLQFYPLVWSRCCSASGIVP